MSHPTTLERPSFRGNLSQGPTGRTPRSPLVVAGKTMKQSRMTPHSMQSHGVGCSPTCVVCSVLLSIGQAGVGGLRKRLRYLTC